MEHRAAATLPEIYELNTLDFSLGIRAREINQNFDLVKYWIDSERLRIGGWGIVEGFDLSEDLSNPDYLTINVTEGALINRKGEEVLAPAYSWNFNPIPPEPQTDQNVISDSTGKIILSRPIFVANWHGIVSYSAEKQISNEKKQYLARELQIYNERGEELIQGKVSKLEQYVVSIEETSLQLIPQLAEQTFTVKYNYADDRWDAIFIDEFGTEWSEEAWIKPISVGVASTSPSIQDLDQYWRDGKFLIGLAYWHVGQTIAVEFFTNKRMLRPVYVNRENVLYLNGKKYEDKTVIYFTEPKPAQENDLWYCTEDEILYIWRPDENGEYSWVPVNDLARTVTDIYQFQEIENPEDKQTFDFHGHPELYFVPGEHQVTVIIDQVVIMEDQFEELCYDDLAWDQLGEDFTGAAAEEKRNKRKHLRGYGIKLKYPLERPSVVEIRVKHDLNTKKHETDLFQHDSVFLDDNQFEITNTGIRTFLVRCTYESGGQQLEVFKNGLRLVRNIGYQEILQNGTVSTAAGETCNQFRLMEAPTIGDILYYRVIRPIQGYENINNILADYIDTFTTKTQTLQDAIDALESEKDTLTALYNAIDTQVAANTNNITTLQDNTIKKTDKLTTANLTSVIRNNLIAGTIDLNFTASAGNIFLNNISENDYVVVTYCKNNTANPIMLFRNKDYSITNAEDGANLQLNSKWTGTTGAKIYITGLRLGV